jgi:two-component system, OmpR family, alkaline phosphatase synthesis response regulator PhoP
MDSIDRKKVLIADDEPGVRQLVSKILSRDYSVIEARDGEEAVNLVRIHKPNIVIMDMMMPKMDGLTACYAIKKDSSTKNIPVIMLTAIDQELNKRLSTTVMGVNKYMTKPFNAQELLEVLKQMLENAEPVPQA